MTTSLLPKKGLTVPNSVTCMAQVCKDGSGLYGNTTLIPRFQKVNLMRGRISEVCFLFWAKLTEKGPLFFPSTHFQNVDMVYILGLILLLNNCLGH